MDVFYFAPSGLDKGRDLIQFFDQISPKLATTICKKVSAYASLGQIHTSNSLKTLNARIWGYKGTIYKLRVDCGKESARVLFMQTRQHDLVMLHGFLKKTRKTPEKDARIAIAQFDLVQQGEPLTRFPLAAYGLVA